MDHHQLAHACCRQPLDFARGNPSVVGVGFVAVRGRSRGAQHAEHETDERLPGNRDVVHELSLGEPSVGERVDGLNAEEHRELDTRRSHFWVMAQQK